MARWCGAFVIAWVASTGAAFAGEAMLGQTFDPLSPGEMAEVRAGGQFATAQVAAPEFSPSVPAVSLEGAQGITVVQLNSGVNSRQSTRIDVNITFSDNRIDSTSGIGSFANAW